MNEPTDNNIQLDQFLKLKGLAQSGGEAKHLIREGLVSVNGEIETRRGRKLKPGDLVKFQDQALTVE
jgi:ribosome-associated protein